MAKALSLDLRQSVASDPGYLPGEEHISSLLATHSAEDKDCDDQFSSPGGFHFSGDLTGCVGGLVLAASSGAFAAETASRL